ncbi:MAG: serine acetyltransferase, partial [SAR324 cluster bacterium]|nr:serine acetyltransferase [SAR324 cluster bacterium]
MPEIDKKEKCRTDQNSAMVRRRELSKVAEIIIENCEDTDCFLHADFEPIPSVESVVEILNRLREILFPGFFGSQRLNPVNLKYIMGQSVSALYDLLSEQITNSIRHDCIRYDQQCDDCAEKGQQATLDLLRSIPLIRKSLSKDVRAPFDGDPAARSYDEII